LLAACCCPAPGASFMNISHASMLDFLHFSNPLCTNGRSYRKCHANFITAKKQTYIHKKYQ
jgi:hypothetical protein